MSVEFAGLDTQFSLYNNISTFFGEFVHARSPQEKEMLQRDIKSIDQAIDALVHCLYVLTEAEIKIIDGGSERHRQAYGRYKLRPCEVAKPRTRNFKII